ncbi:MAG: hypothetical protein K6E79_03155 [Pseudobutyrivibrio sp.]|nr:hypothetical protein [Pseudobutyrivibrio sp.]
MSRGITGNEPDPRIVYKDIIDMPHHQSTTHPHMSLYDRAAQFAPFAALTGYDDMVREEARITKSAVTLSDSVNDILSEKLNIIANAIQNGKHPTVTITYFVRDITKVGGDYVTTTEQIKKIDIVQGELILMKTKEFSGLNLTINLHDITDIHGDLVDYVDDY